MNKKNYVDIPPKYLRGLVASGMVEYLLSMLKKMSLQQKQLITVTTVVADCPDMMSATMREQWRTSLVFKMLPKGGSCYWHIRYYKRLHYN